MASNFRQSRIIVGDGDPADGDGICTNLSLFPINTMYLNSETGTVFVRNTSNGNAADYVSGSVASFSFYAENTSPGGELAAITVTNETGDDNVSQITGISGDTTAEVQLNVNFNGAEESAQIKVHAESGSSSITHTADTHTFNVGYDGLLIGNNGVADLRAFNNTDDGNLGSFSSDATTTEINTRLKASFNDEVKLAQIELFADATIATIELTGVPVFADDTAAAGGGLTSGMLYQTTSGGSTFLKIVP